MTASSAEVLIERDRLQRLIDGGMTADHLQNLLDSVIAEAKRACAQLRQNSVSTSDHQHTMHALRGAAGMVGLAHVCALARLVEDRLISGLDAASILDDFEHAVCATERALKEANLET